MEWNEVVQVDISGTRIAAKDAMVMLSEGETEPGPPFVNVQPGLYVAEIDLASARHCRRFRIRRVESNPKLGRALQRLEIDCAKAAFVDYDTLHSAVRADYESYESWTEMELDDELVSNFSGIIKFGGAPLVYAQSGDGDGSYKTFELVEGEDIVGLECQFE